ncbi:MAG: gliding motility-associated C-terminal domain-containing protein [Muribaculaceae bacterium]
MNAITKHITIAALAAVAALSAQAQLSFSGNTLPAITAEAERASGIEAIYVLNGTAGVNISYTASSSSVTWNRYGAPGTPMTEVSNVVRNGNTYSITADSGDTGYVISDGTNQHYFWVTDYSGHQLDITGVDISPESACDRTVLNISGHGDAIRYYSISGRGFDLSREIKIEWNTLQYNSDQQTWQQIRQTENMTYLHNVTGVIAPVCDTDFTVTGDRFLEAWGMGLSVSSPSYTAIAVSAETSAEQEERDNSNEKNPGTDGLGGSAPAVITFTAQPTDAVVFREWQFSRTEGFEDVDRRFSQDELTYTFEEEGTIYVRYQCSDAGGKCFYESETYTVSIGASDIQCPNAFSPNGDGRNDEWKVSYQSIVSFECHIFNRWGQKMCSFTNPADGWDGKYKGKTVPTGVYFYVIKAKGADGKDYKLSGDINILQKGRSTGTTGGEGGGGETPAE